MTDDESARAVTRTLVDLFQTARLVDLTHTIEQGMPVYPTHPQYFAMQWDTHDPASMNQLLIGEHAGTHLDSPSHFYPHQDDPSVGDVASVPLESAIGPAVKLDFLHADVHEELSAADIRRWENTNRPLRSGEAAVFHFGGYARWGTYAAAAAYLESWPGLSREAAAYLVDVGVRAVCTDCLGIDGSGASELAAHLELLEHGIVIVENLCALAEVPEEFLLLTLPLKLAGGTGSPVRAVAVFADEGTGGR